MRAVASAPDDVKRRGAPLLRFASALRVTSPSAAARCAYAESRAFGVGDATIIIKAASTRVVLDAKLSTRPRNRGRLIVRPESTFVWSADVLVERRGSARRTIAFSAGESPPLHTF